MALRLDINGPEFQAQWFKQEKEERIAVLHTLVKLAALNWEGLYCDRAVSTGN